MNLSILVIVVRRFSYAIQAMILCSIGNPFIIIISVIMAGTIAGGIVILLGIIFVLMPKR